MSHSHLQEALVKEEKRSAQLSVLQIITNGKATANSFHPLTLTRLCFMHSTPTQHLWAHTPTLSLIFFGVRVLCGSECSWCQRYPKKSHAGREGERQVGSDRVLEGGGVKHETCVCVCVVISCISQCESQIHIGIILNHTHNTHLPPHPTPVAAALAQSLIGHGLQTEEEHWLKGRKG